MTSTPIVKIVSPRDGFERGVSSLVDCVVRKIIFFEIESVLFIKVWEPHRGKKFIYFVSYRL